MNIILTASQNVDTGLFGIFAFLGFLIYCGFGAGFLYYWMKSDRLKAELEREKNKNKKLSDELAAYKTGNAVVKKINKKKVIIPIKGKAATRKPVVAKSSRKSRLKQRRHAYHANSSAFRNLGREVVKLWQADFLKIKTICFYFGLYTGALFIWARARYGEPRDFAIFEFDLQKSLKNLLNALPNMSDIELHENVLYAVEKKKIDKWLGRLLSMYDQFDLLAKQSPLKRSYARHICELLSSLRKQAGLTVPSVPQEAGGRQCYLIKSLEAFTLLEEINRLSYKMNISYIAHRSQLCDLLKALKLQMKQEFSVSKDSDKLGTVDVSLEVAQNFLMKVQNIQWRLDSVFPRGHKLYVAFEESISALNRKHSDVFMYNQSQEVGISKSNIFDVLTCVNAAVSTLHSK